MLVQDKAERIEVVPAKFGWVNERVMVRPPSEKLVAVPAVYQTVREKILVRPGYTTWKRGRGPIERVDHATGEIMCLVEVPDQYKTVSKRVLKTPEATRRVAVSAKYKTIRKRVVIEPARTRTVTIPAKYRAQTMTELVREAQEKRTVIPAKHRKIKKRIKVSEGQLAWRPILCETNTTRGVVKRLQTALKRAGFNPGDIDGALGRRTMAATKAYQRSKGLASGQLTLETLRALRVDL